MEIVYHKVDCLCLCFVNSDRKWQQKPDYEAEGQTDCHGSYIFWTVVQKHNISNIHN